MCVGGVGIVSRFLRAPVCVVGFLSMASGGVCGSYAFVCSVVDVVCACLSYCVPFRLLACVCYVLPLCFAFRLLWRICFLYCYCLFLASLYVFEVLAGLFCVHFVLGFSLMFVLHCVYICVMFVYAFLFCGQPFLLVFS